MPSYSWLILDKHDRSDVEDKMEAMVSLGVPYTEEDIANAQANMAEQATQIEKNLYTDPDFAKSYEADKKYATENGEEFIEMRDREIVSLIAYLQRLGTDIKIKETEELISKKKSHAKIRKRVYGKYRGRCHLFHDFAAHLLRVLCTAFLVGLYRLERSY
jgi:cytochrome c oxidase cbb3-type subunit I/II